MKINHFVLAVCASLVLLFFSCQNNKVKEKPDDNQQKLLMPMEVSKDFVKVVAPEDGIVGDSTELLKAGLLNFLPFVWQNTKCPISYGRKCMIGQ